MSEQKSEWQKVVCPKGAKPNQPVTISVTGTAKAPYFRISMSAALVSRVGATKGEPFVLYLNQAVTQLRVVREEGPDARDVRMMGGTRSSLEFPYRPFSKILPSKLLCTQVPLVSAKKGELIIELPACVKRRA